MLLRSAQPALDRQTLTVLLLGVLLAEYLVWNADKVDCTDRVQSRDDNQITKGKEKTMNYQNEREHDRNLICLVNDLFRNNLIDIFRKE